MKPPTTNIGKGNLPGKLSVFYSVLCSHLVR